MRYVVYNTETTRIEKEKRLGKESYSTEAAAKAARTRMLKKTGHDPAQLAVADVEVYRTCIVKMVEKTNLMSGKTFWTSVNTPACCDPSTETYWSM